MTSENSISFLAEGVSFDLNHQNTIDLWIKQVIKTEGKVIGEISYIFCSDAYLLKINQEHLNHDDYTDIITFDYCVEDNINSDIFISIDRVKENARSYKVAFQEELTRVMVHGVLHLLGYNDKSEEEKVLMRKKEDFYLSLLTN